MLSQSSRQRPIPFAPKDDAAEPGSTDADGFDWSNGATKRGADDMSTTPYGFRDVGGKTGERRLVDQQAALAGYAACDPRAEVDREAYLSHFTFGIEFQKHLEQERIEIHPLACTRGGASASALSCGGELGRIRLPDRAGSCPAHRGRPRLGADAQRDDATDRLRLGSCQATAGRGSVMSEARFQSAADLLDAWRDDVLSGKPPTLYPVGTGELAGSKSGRGS